MVILLEKLRGINSGRHWGQKLVLREVPLMGSQEEMDIVVMENLRYIHWESHFVRMVEMR